MFSFHIFTSVVLTTDTILPTSWLVPYEVGMITAFLWTVSQQMMFGAASSTEESLRWFSTHTLEDHSYLLQSCIHLGGDFWIQQFWMLCDFLLNYFLGNKETTSGNGVSLQDASSLCCAGKARCCWLHSVGILMADVSAAEPLRTLQAMLKTYHPKYLTV